ISEVADALTVSVADLLSAIEDIVVDIRRDHQELVDEAGGKWAVVTFPCMKQRHLGNEIAHAMSDDRNLCLAGFAWIRHRGGLIATKRDVETAQNVSQIVGAHPRFLAVGQVIVNLPLGRQGNEDANSEAVIAVENSVVHNRDSIGAKLGVSDIIS